MPRLASTGLAFGRDLPATLTGRARWRALADRALAEVAATPDDLLIIGSCNGAAHALDAAEWARAFDDLGAPAVTSASCASGLHALWWAEALVAAGAPSAIALACDIASPASLANFATLRVLADGPTLPWQGDSPGFVHGEAAAAVRVVREPDTSAFACPPVRLGQSLAEMVSGSGAGEIVIGQGTGPGLVDDIELEIVRTFAGQDVPIACATFAHGHALGASSLVPVVMAVRGAETGLSGRTRDGREMASVIPPGARAAILCRALGGGAAVVAEGPAVTPRWVGPRPVNAFTSVVRAAAASPRPELPPAAVVVVLERPLVPPERARRGDRLLPSAVLEITPGHIAVAVARAWGYEGPATTLVGVPPRRWLDALAQRGEVHVLYVRGHGDERDLAWERLARG